MRNTSCLTSILFAATRPTQMVDHRRTAVVGADALNFRHAEIGNWRRKRARTNTTPTSPPVVFLVKPARAARTQDMCLLAFLIAASQS
ncbi:hypothetical protein K437DRAFT_170983 [Tilletiaria anomala UBC 951]|uniref:Uncharacterized protein n=1 Tax=Tilletiaria anomala (strain ATCC 24038 / CBS 436.72 / UBC 951) TaxID=1037660 RepID=A0A066VS83_TILAU|nr:uncharacterized protein K437DRAFT_170983 [Tilletiaria anomala UBC 951]KDN41664.1 hypothetical protein K437DRAFT_170983 [Tilletiaria anomala UBC 951]